ncbi:hypothetical protein [Planosporangium flavigriseum]|uniref:PH domain-containing protein n=1 Tax=Planosporangium flavigriseum TaxID=373681 RepID=A0A8J3LSB9_9ACTN|nr:hypothetical protein Pfl04_51130 [Planosporangium flavigriseum]
MRPWHVGVDTAGQLLVTAGDNPERLRSEAKFARLCGAASITPGGRSMNPTRTRVIGPSRGFACGALLVVAGLTAISPLVEWSAFGLSATLAIPAFTLSVTLALWIFDFAPRLAWNAHGLAVRSFWRVARVPWGKVGALTIGESGVSGDRITVHLAERRFEVGLDRFWWLTRLSPQYANRNRQYLENLRECRQRVQDLSEVGEPPVLRSVGPLLGTFACWAIGLFIAIYLF